VKEATERHEAEVAEVLERRRLREEQHAVQKRAHEESVAAAAAARAKAARDLAAKLAASPPAAGPRVAAPVPPGMPHPAPLTGTVAMSATAPQRKICPTCGDRFDATTDYCGKDGTHLVLLN
jgi:hypothetical protein